MISGDLSRCTIAFSIVADYLTRNVWVKKLNTEPVVSLKFREKSTIVAWFLENNRGYDLYCYRVSEWLDHSHVHFAVVIDDILVTVATDQKLQTMKTISFSNMVESGGDEFVRALKEATAERALLAQD